MNNDRTGRDQWFDRADQAAHNFKDRILKSYSVAPPPEVAYHYSGTESMYGILTKEVWLSDLAFMNDPAEGALIEVLLGILEAKHGSDWTPYLIKHLRENAAHAPSSHSSEPGTRISFRYVLSLAQDRDCLNLWRFYGDDGNGYSVGIDLTLLESSINQALPELAKSASSNMTAIRPIELKRVSYEEDMTPLAELIVNEIEKDSDLNTLAEDPAGHRNLIAWTIINRIYEIAYFFKSQDWADEKEIRVMTAGNYYVSDHIYRDSRGHHTSGKYLVPHIAIPTGLSSGIVKSITAGPRLDQHFVQRSFEQVIAPTEPRFSLLRNDNFLKFSTRRYR